MIIYILNLHLIKIIPDITTCILHVFILLLHLFFAIIIFILDLGHIVLCFLEVKLEFSKVGLFLLLFGGRGFVDNLYHDVDEDYKGKHKD